MSARLIRWQSAHLTDLLLIKSVWKIRKNSLKWEVASNWHLTFFGWNSPKKYVFTRIFYKSTEFPTNRKKLDCSPPLILKLKFIAFIIFLQNSNRSNMCAAIAQRRLVTRKFQIEENMRIVALKEIWDFTVYVLHQNWCIILNNLQCLAYRIKATTTKYIQDTAKGTKEKKWEKLKSWAMLGNPSLSTR